MHTDRVEFLSVGFDRLTIDDVLGRLSQVRAEAPFSYVVTPNVDHVVRLESSIEARELRPVYREAHLSLCDSRVLRGLARLHGINLPLVPGSDLTVRIFNEVIRPDDRIAILGGDDELVKELKTQFPRINFVHFSPPMGLRHSAPAREEAAEFIASAKARFTFIAVGSPQQEMIAAAVASRMGATGTALCIGASLKFITGRERRAPDSLQWLHLEWAYRLLANPRRMWRRYLIEGPRIFVMAARYNRKRPAK